MGPPLLAAAAAVAILYGDGVHDDTCAINAWGRGEPVVWASGEAIPRDVLDGKGRNFLVHGAIALADGRKTIENMIIHPTKTLEAMIVVGQPLPDAACEATGPPIS